MNKKYALRHLHGGWVIVMASNGQMMAKGFGTEAAAACARDEFERGERKVETKMDVWVIAEAFVCEPYLGGKLIGEAGTLDMRQYNVVERLSQSEFDRLMNEFNDANGHYPDT